MLRITLCLAVAVCAGGCFVALPARSNCPGAPVHAPDEVVAFVVRARVAQHGTAPVPEETHTLRRVDLADGAVPAQSLLYAVRGVPVLGTVRSEYVMTKLYRRGCRTVILEPGHDVERVGWEEAASASDQEDAVLQLLYHTRPALCPDHKPVLAPGSADPRHREVLLFAADELARVARRHDVKSAHPGRCEKYARDLRKLADE